MYSLLIGLSSMFFVLGHSSLLYFKVKEDGEIPIFSVFLPYPKSGKFVSFLSIFVSFVFLISFCFLLSVDDSFDGFNLKVFVVFCVFPLFAYCRYIMRGIKKKNGFLFFSEPKSEWREIMALSAVISFLSYFLSCFLK